MVYTTALLIGVEFGIPLMAQMTGMADWSNAMPMLLIYSVWPLSLIVFMAWLLPAKKASALKRA